MLLKLVVLLVCTLTLITCYKGELSYIEPPTFKQVGVVGMPWPYPYFNAYYTLYDENIEPDDYQLYITMSPPNCTTLYNNPLSTESSDYFFYFSFVSVPGVCVLSYSWSDGSLAPFNTTLVALDETCKEQQLVNEPIKEPNLFAILSMVVFAILYSIFIITYTFCAKFKTYYKPKSTH